MAETQAPEIPQIPSFSDESIPLDIRPTRPLVVTAAQDRALRRLTMPQLRPLVIEPSRDTALIPVEFPFSGAWIPDEDPLKIREHNFADLQNFRYSNSGLIGVAGLTRLTTINGVTVKNGIHFPKIIAGAQASYVLIQTTLPNIYANTTAIPGAGTFGSALLSSEAGGGLARFSLWPDGTVAMCDGIGAYIWGTPEHRVGAVINYDEAGTFRYDWTAKLTNPLTDASDLATLIRDAGNVIWLLIGSLRPLQAIKFYVQTPNGAASTSSVEYWDGSAWAALAIIDGTAVGGVTLAQTGSMGFTSTQALANVKYSDGRALYFYRVKVGATGTPQAGIQLSYVTGDAPVQPIIDIWDGVERNPVFAAQGGTDYTLEVQQPSPVSAPQALTVNGVLALVVIFETPMQALRFQINGSKGNSAGASLNVYYWDGTAFSSVGSIVDTTAQGGAPLHVSGSITWNPDGFLREQPVTEQTPTSYNFGGVTGYAYQVTSSGNLGGGADVLIDVISGIPVQRWNVTRPVTAYRFPFSFAGRAMLANRIATNEANRIDYSAPGQPDVWNGKQSSDLGKPIYIGTSQEPLSCAIELSNRYAGVATNFAFVLKNGETWILEGTTPDTFVQYRISDQVGCPAPLSLCLAEIPAGTDFELRTVALWCSAKGPVMSNGSVIIPLRFPQPDGQISSVEAYFNPDDSRYVNTARWEQVAGWYDAQHSEYNLVLPSGASATTCNAWLVCDLLRHKWYRKVPASYPQCGWQVKDTLGTTYVYAGLAVGHMVRLEYGNTWDGSDIMHLVQTADMILPLTRAEGSLWEETLIRYIKFLAVAESGTEIDVALQHAPNGTGVFTSFNTISLAVSGSRRWNVLTTAVNLRSLSHQFQLQATTNTKARAPRMLGLGALVRSDRMTLSDVNS
jgi:hypothetical protein